MSLIYIIEDEPIMADCIAADIKNLSAEPLQVEVFNDAVAAMEAVNERLPDAILLDVMLSGPDGFAFLNEMISYTDTAKVPVVLMSSLDLPGRDLSHYGVVQILDKAKMTPTDIYDALQQALQNGLTLATPPAPASELIPEPAESSEPIITPAPVVDNPAPTSVSTSGLDDFKQKLAQSGDSDLNA